MMTADGATLFFLYDFTNSNDLNQGIGIHRQHPVTQNLCRHKIFFFCRMNSMFSNQGRNFFYLFLPAIIAESESPDHADSALPVVQPSESDAKDTSTSLSILGLAYRLQLWFNNLQSAPGNKTY